MSDLARPQWRKGQVLQPEHFQSLEAALSAESALRSELLGLPLHGLSRLLWNGDRPKAGVLTVWELIAVLPDGAIIDVPGNASFVDPSLSLKAAGRRQVDVFVHLITRGEDSGEAALTPDAPGSIPRAYHELVLSCDAHHRGGGQRILLGRFEQGESGDFTLCQDFVPPLTNLADTSSLGVRLKTTVTVLGQLRSSLEEQALSALSRGDGQATVTRVWIEARKLEEFLGDCLSGLPLHPYPVFLALRNFTLELSLLADSLPDATLPRYDHDNLVASFLPLIERIERSVRIPTRGEPFVEFTADAGRMVAVIPDSAVDAKEFWVGVLKRNQVEVPRLEQLVVASPGRLRLVRERSLRSMYLSRSDASPLRERLAGPIDTYRIEGAGALGTGDRREWLAALDERALAFVAPEEARTSKIVLYWRLP